ncbi:MAG TPA: hypothetical protein VG899_11880 [Mycobacteriales bacterium]|nr:hypothetical protein [Mycobacteriales bacterium]
MVSFLLSVTFACGVIIAISHVINRPFVAPVYDVVANLTAFSCAIAASLLLGHWIPAALSCVAVVCWLVLAHRTFSSLRNRRNSAEGRDVHAEVVAKAPAAGVGDLHRPVRR